MKEIYTYWDSSEHAPKHQAELLRLWERSWTARGWKTRILTVRNAQKHPMFKRSAPSSYAGLASYVAKATYVSDISSINFGLTPAKAKTGISSIRFLSEGWRGALVVDFENCHPDIIINCGRTI